MLLRTAYPFLAGVLALSVSGCGGWFEREQREAWRGQAEIACLNSGAIRESANIRITKAIEGPGVCGLDYPVRVKAVEGVANWPQMFSQARDDAFGAPLSPFQQGGQSRFMVAINKEVPLSCPMVPKLTQWLTGVVQPAAAAGFGSPVVEMMTAGTYSCRKRRLNAKRWSEHAFANAIDVSGFRLQDGRVVKIGSGWRGDAAEQRFWRDVLYGGCSLFNTVLGPGSDGMHENHLHLDMARHSSKRQTRYCRPRVPSGWEALASSASAMAYSSEATGSISEPDETAKEPDPADLDE